MFSALYIVFNWIGELESGGLLGCRREGPATAEVKSSAGPKNPTLPRNRQGWGTRNCKHSEKAGPPARRNIPFATGLISSAWQNPAASDVLRRRQAALLTLAISVHYCIGTSEASELQLRGRSERNDQNLQ
jgi:hypothetical protein